MLLLTLYVSLAIGVSFLCSIAESVLLSVNPTYTLLLEKNGRRSGRILKRLKAEIDKPLAAILTLNTIAHTVGAAGAGAQAQNVFGDHLVALISAVLTFLILVFSEIIPKTLGAHYWRQLAPATAVFLKYLIIMLYPFVKMSEQITRRIGASEHSRGFSREEFSVMADLSVREGKLRENESRMLKNLLYMRDTPVADGMTPSTVIYSVHGQLTVEEFFQNHHNGTFSRIPIYNKHSDDIVGFVFRIDLLLAKAKGKTQTKLVDYANDLPSVLKTTPMASAFEIFLTKRTHMMLVVTEYGEVKGLITLEDVIETLLGLEIIDEKDRTIDMQAEARKLWEKRAKTMGIDLDQFDDENKTQE